MTTHTSATRATRCVRPMRTPPDRRRPRGSMRPATHATTRLRARGPIGPTKREECSARNERRCRCRHAGRPSRRPSPMTCNPSTCGCKTPHRGVAAPTQTTIRMDWLEANPCGCLHIRASPFRARRSAATRQTAAHASAAIHPQPAAILRRRSTCAAPCCSASKAKIHCDGGTRKVSSSRRIERARERGADGADGAQDLCAYRHRRTGCRKFRSA